MTSIIFECMYVYVCINVLIMSWLTPRIGTIVKRVKSEDPWIRVENIFFYLLSLARSDAGISGGGGRGRRNATLTPS